MTVIHKREYISQPRHGELISNLAVTKRPMPKSGMLQAESDTEEYISIRDSEILAGLLDMRSIAKK